MGLFVNTNVSSLSAQRQLFDSGNALSNAFEQLSSGFRINRAADDAAGLQITDRMTSQIQGLNQSVRNANDAISLVQTAEGALSETTTNLQRLRQLAVQAQNGIYSQADRNALQQEANQLFNEINRIANDTQFAGNDILSGSFSTVFQVGANAGQSIAVGLSQFSGAGFGLAGLGIQSLDITTGIQGAEVGPDIISGATAWDDFDNVYDFNSGIGPATVAGTYRFAVSNDSGATYTEISVDLDPANGFMVDNFAFENAVESALGENILVTPGGVHVNNGDGTFRIAADSTNPAALTASPLGANTGTIGTYDGSLVAEGSTVLDAIDGALSRVGGVRAELGATQNRFQSTIRNLSNVAENLSSSRSQIQDTDFASATATLTKNQIIQQASTSILAQANQRPQAALSLLG